MMGAAGGGPPVYIEDVFSTWLYTGNGSTQTITNGIDLAGKGGLVWIKRRNLNDSHWLFDTNRGMTFSSANYIATNSSSQQFSDLNVMRADATGFSWGSNSSTSSFNGSSGTFVSWTFRKQPKFFDVVTYTGDGTFPRAIPHNLGSIPGCIIIKCTSHATNWLVSHRGMSDPIGNLLNLNSTAAETGVTNGNNNNGYFSSTTSTLFYVGNNAEINAVGRTYVAYLFAHNAGGFGASGTDNVISCGSYTGTGSYPIEVTVGYEPQWLLVKRASGGTSDWYLLDNMRGMVASEGGSNDRELYPQSTASEQLSLSFGPTATGFTVKNVGAINNAGDTYIYIAIRRGPMRTPTTGTSVFQVSSATNPAPRWKTSSPQFPVDMSFFNDTTGVAGSGRDFHWADRLRGVPVLKSTSTAAESTTTSFPSVSWDYMNGFYSVSTSGTDQYGWMFRRAPGFFDVVCYTGNTTTGATQTHNLGLTPELMIVKYRSASYNWFVYSQTLGATKFLVLNQTNAEGTGTFWNNTAPTSSVFTLSNQSHVNGIGSTYVAYLFATVAGVSKVGSYTGTGSTVQVDCGFTAGARFVLIKRTDATGDWYVWDSARGIVSANDPHLSLNTTAAQVTTNDSVDPDSSGFIVNQVAATNINVNGATYIYLAIA